jgi:hypothetical protein
MINTSDGNFVMACHYGYGGETFGTLIKLDNNLDTIWQRHYHPAYKTITVNSIETNDDGYILTGWVWEDENDYGNSLLIKVNNNGDIQWYNTYGGNLSELGSNAIQTPDGGYLIGGFHSNPPVFHSMDAMVIKTDSLGNEQWTKYFGNPNIDDDMAFVALADDGNYLVATVYGDSIWNSETRTGSFHILKINSNGNIIWDKTIGVPTLDLFIRNFKSTNNNEYIANGFFSYLKTFPIFIEYYSGWILKTDINGDSIWMREYNHFNEIYAYNMLYDVTPTQDDGYVCIGRSNEGFTQANMWVLKVDNMGCDTPGCATGTFV